MNSLKSKQLSQVFLNNSIFAAKFTEYSNIQKEDHIIEIGIGKLIITNEIIKQSPKYITLIEIDEYLCLKAIEHTKKYTNISIVNKNCLHFDYSFLKDQSVKLISNLPFNISKKFIYDVLLKYRYIFTSCVIGMQKELVQSIILKNQCCTTATGVILNIFFKITPYEKIDKQFFTPKPSVDTQIILLEKKDIVDIDVKKFIHYIRLFFKTKRKKIKNILTKDQISSYINDIDIEKRPHEIDINQFLQNFFKNVQ